MNRKTTGIWAAAALSLVLAACGSSAATTDTAASAEKTEAASAAEETKQAAEKTEGNTAVKTVTPGSLIMCTNAEFPPYEFHNGNEIVGIDVEICNAIAEKLGLKLEIEDIAFDAIIPEIVSGKADLGAAGMTVTEDRKQNVDFSDSYAHATQVIIIREDSDIAGPDDLKGKLVGVQQGTTGDLYVSADLGDDAVERYSKGMEAVQALTQSKVVPGLRILDESYTDEEYAIAVQKGNTQLLDAINTAIGELKKNGTFDKIVEKYIKAE